MKYSDFQKLAKRSGLKSNLQSASRLNPPRDSLVKVVSEDKRTVEGIIFASGSEAKRYMTLRLLQSQGKIEKLKAQETFEIQPPFTHFHEEIKPIYYTPDFTYYDNEKKRWVAEEVKGYLTGENKLRIKMFRYTFPDYYFNLIFSENV